MLQVCKSRLGRIMGDCGHDSRDTEESWNTSEEDCVMTRVICIQGTLLFKEHVD